MGKVAMFLSHEQLQETSRALDLARQTFQCQRPRVDADGRDYRIEAKPKARSADVKANGVRVPLGVHGNAFIQIDPVTLEVRCGACAGELDATVR